MITPKNTDKLYLNPRLNLVQITGILGKAVVFRLRLCQARVELRLNNRSLSSDTKTFCFKLNLAVLNSKTSQQRIST